MAIDMGDFTMPSDGVEFGQVVQNDDSTGGRTEARPYTRDRVRVVGTALWMSVEGTNKSS